MGLFAQQGSSSAVLCSRYAPRPAGSDAAPARLHWNAHVLLFGSKPSVYFIASEACIQSVAKWQSWTTLYGSCDTKESMQDMGNLKLLSTCHIILLIGSCPVPVVLDTLQFQFTLRLGLGSLQNCWSVMQQPLICAVFLCSQLWVNHHIRQAWNGNECAQEVITGLSQKHTILLCDEGDSPED